ncbi:protein FAM234A-like, partial [Limulus polyphemus]|uniref:Protein FAM234A-like n=1 Tax=Limulus polyphemus TaxID=6850 RepID=A0ABM1TQF3_LIMPO
MKERLPNYFPLLEQISEDDDDDDIGCCSSSGNQKCSTKSLDLEKPKHGERTTEASIGLMPPLQTETEVSLGPMSPVQKLLFLLSLLLCLLFFITFGWLLPCNLPGFSGQQKQEKANWLARLNNTEITTNLEAVALKFGGPPFLVIFGMRSKANNSDNAGLMALSQSDGKTLWYVPLHSMPTSLKCNMLDINRDGVMDCIVRGQNGLFVAVNSINGHTFWYLHNHNNQPPPVGLSAPVIIPDCDGDLVPEIVVAYRIQNVNSDNNDSSLTYMAVVSSSSGQLLGLLHHLEVCNKIPAIVTRQTDDIENIDIVFFCSNGSNDGNVWVLPSSSLCKSGTVHSDALNSLRSVYG